MINVPYQISFWCLDSSFFLNKNDKSTSTTAEFCNETSMLKAFLLSDNNCTLFTIYYWNTLPAKYYLVFQLKKRINPHSSLIKHDTSSNGGKYKVVVLSW